MTQPGTRLPYFGDVTDGAARQIVEIRHKDGWSTISATEAHLLPKLVEALKDLKHAEEKRRMHINQGNPHPIDEARIVNALAAATDIIRSIEEGR